MKPFSKRLDEAIQRTGSLLCVGLDPQPGRTPAPIDEYCARVVDLTYEFAVAFKPNSAFFEAAGTEGLSMLERVIAHVPDERIVILDAKRGDIASTGEAYAQAAFGVLGADAVTVVPYLGDDAVAPFLADPARGAFILCHTTNPGAGTFQSLDVGGRSLYHAVARQAVSWNEHGNGGRVVGAASTAALAAVRAPRPHVPCLWGGD